MLSTGGIMVTFTLGDPSTLSFSAMGWTIDNLHYAVSGGASVGGYWGTPNWCSPENNSGNLYIQGRITPINAIPNR